MTETVAFDDAVALCVAFLKAQFASRNETAKVASKVPNPRPNRLVRVSYGGGVRADLVHDAARVTFDSWDVDEVSAAGLHRLTRAIMGSLIEGGDLSSGWTAQVKEVGNPGLYPDPDTNLPRFQFTAELLIEGTAI